MNRKHVLSFSLLLLVYIVKYGYCMQLRILLQLPLDPEALKTAQQTGTAASFMRYIICRNLFRRHTWFIGCSVYKYHFSQTSNVLTTMLVDTQTSDEANIALRHVSDIDIKLFLINRKLNQDLGLVQTAVDLPMDHEWRLEELAGTPDGNIQFKAKTSALIKMDDFCGVPLLPVTFNDIKMDLVDYFQSKIQSVLGNNAEFVSVLPQSLLDYNGETIVKVSFQFLRKNVPLETNMPEQWKMGLQGVIDLFSTTAGFERNFMLPVFMDLRDLDTLSVELDILIPQYVPITGIQTGDPRQCNEVQYFLTPLDLGDYGCYPSKRYIDSNGDIYIKVQLLLPKMKILKPEYSLTSDLAFTELLKNKWPGIHFSLYTHKDKATYEYYSDPEDLDHYVLALWMFVSTTNLMNPLERIYWEGSGGRRGGTAELFSMITLGLRILQKHVNIRWFEYNVIGNAVILNAVVRINKNTEYWNEENPWTVPFRIAHKLQIVTDKMMDVRWRRRDKYAAMAAHC